LKVAGEDDLHPDVKRPHRCRASTLIRGRASGPVEASTAPSRAASELKRFSERGDPGVILSTAADISVPISARSGHSSGGLSPDVTTA
jgi:hypothetical protein